MSDMKSAIYADEDERESLEIHVTEWADGEGLNVMTHGNDPQNFRLSAWELHALITVAQAMGYVDTGWVNIECASIKDAYEKKQASYRSIADKVTGV